LDGDLEGFGLTGLGDRFVVLFLRGRFDMQKHFLDQSPSGVVAFGQVFLRFSSHNVFLGEALLNADLEADLEALRDELVSVLETVGLAERELCDPCEVCVAP
jgi:hypothetical protein